MKIGKYLFEWYEIPKTKNTGKTLWASQIKNYVTKTCETNTADNKYDLITVKDMKQVIALNRFKNNTQHPYKKRVRDCDDYSFALMGMIRKLLPGVCFGIAWVDAKDNKGKRLYKHALNNFIDNNKTFWYVEPQTNKIFYKTKRLEPFLLVV